MFTIQRCFSSLVPSTVKMSREPDTQIRGLYGTLNENLIQNFEINIREILLVTVCYLTFLVTGWSFQSGR